MCSIGNTLIHLHHSFNPGPAFHPSMLVDPWVSREPYLKTLGWLAGWLLHPDSLPSDTGNSGSKEGKCFLVGSFFLLAQVSQVGWLPVNFRLEMFRFPRFVFAKVEFQVGKPTPGAKSFWESWYQKMEVNNINIRYRFNWPAVIFGGDSSSFPYMKPVFHIHMILKKKWGFFQF